MAGGGGTGCQVLGLGFAGVFTLVYAWGLLERCRVHRYEGFGFSKDRGFFGTPGTLGLQGESGVSMKGSEPS